MMTPTKLPKLPDPEPPCIILAMVDGNGVTAKRRESYLKDTIWREVRTCQFMNTQDSAWTILDTILGVNPVKLQYIQDELDGICSTLPTQFASRPNRCFFSSLFSFKLGRRVSAFFLTLFFPPR
jgi:hypothetical protein